MEKIYFSLRTEQNVTCGTTKYHARCKEGYSGGTTTLFPGIYHFLVITVYTTYTLCCCCLRLTHPTPGFEPGGRIRCAISIISSVSATLDTPPC